MRRVRSGEFTPVLRDECTPSSTREPAGTRSQMISYLNGEGQRVFTVHQYLRPDGSIGGSGLPDPKFLVEGGIEYWCREGA